MLVNYAALADDVITADIKDDAIKTKGYFIYPSQLFVDIAAGANNNDDLPVTSYVEAEDTREVIDITKLNAELKTTVAKIDQLRSDIDTIVAEIEA